MPGTDAWDHLRWRTPEALLELGLGRSRMVMVNEAHNVDLRCVRTREIGRRLLPVAHRLGVRHLAMETLWNGGLRHLTREANATRRLPVVASGYLAQPEMRALIQDSLDLGWTLHPYEADFDQPPPGTVARTEKEWRGIERRGRIDWREGEQARNLVAVLRSLPEDARLLVWCGWSHLAKAPLQGMPWMACRFTQLSGIEPFCIDQTVTVSLGPDHAPFRDFLSAVRPRLEALGGTAGLLAEEAAQAPEMSEMVARADAFVFSLHNEVE